MGDLNKLGKLINLWSYSLSKGASDLFGMDAPFVCTEAGRAALEELEKEGVALIKETPLDTINSIYGYFQDSGYFDDAWARPEAGEKGGIELYEKGSIVFESNRRILSDGSCGAPSCFCSSVIRYALYGRFSLDMKVLDIKTDYETKEDRLMAALVPFDAGALHSISLMNELRREETELKRVREDFRRAVDMSLDAIVSAGNDGRIVLWNPAAELMFGYSREEALRLSVEALVPEEYKESHISALKKFFFTGKSVRLGKVFEILGVKKDGARFPIEVSLSSEGTDGGWVFTGVIRDITERRKLEEELEERVVELERFNKIMIGRELKMEELRKEIVGLRLRIGEKADR